MTLFAALVGVGGGGLGGAALAHWTVASFDRLGAETWLKGPYGPPFFNISLYMGVLMAAIAYALSRSWKSAAAGFAGAFGGMILPMALLTRIARLEDKTVLIGGVETSIWVPIVTGVYALAAWGTLFALGALLAGPKRRIKGALAGAGGAFGGYLLLSGLLRLSPSYGQSLWSPTGFIPSPLALMDGMFTGAGLGTGLWLLLWRNHEKRSGS